MPRSRLPLIVVGAQGPPRGPGMPSLFSLSAMLFGDCPLAYSWKIAGLRLLDPH